MSQDHTLEEDVFTGRIDLALWRKILVFARPYTKLLVALGSIGALVAVFDVRFPLITASIIDGLYKREQTGADPRLGAYLAFYCALVACFAVCIWAL